MEYSNTDILNMTGSFVVVREVPAPTWRDPSPADWKRLMDEVVRPSDGEVSGVNKLSFEKLSKTYGTAYLQYVYSAYSGNGGCMTDEEFCQYYGNIPKGFFDKKIKHETWYKKT
jgi:hypothetical protein